jgi:hypothetical protein
LAVPPQTSIPFIPKQGPAATLHPMHHKNSFQNTGDLNSISHWLQKEARLNTLRTRSKMQLNDPANTKNAILSIG